MFEGKNKINENIVIKFTSLFLLSIQFNSSYSQDTALGIDKTMTETGLQQSRKTL